MNRKDFLRSATLIAGATVVAAPLGSASEVELQPALKVKLKKSLGFGMIREDLSVTSTTRGAGLPRRLAAATEPD